MGTEEKQLNVAGIALQGAQAELGKLLVDNIKYQFAIKQLRELHKRYSGSTKSYPCLCDAEACPTLGVLDALEDQL